MYQISLVLNKSHQNFDEHFHRGLIPCIIGPTAVGKTALGLDLAARLNFQVEVISMDSALVYQGMDIGTGKPNQKELELAPHHLIDIRTPLEVFSAADFNQACIGLIPKILKKNKIPMIIGGTMLYFKALIDGMSLTVGQDTSIREKIAEQAEALGWPALYQELQKADALAASKINPQDYYRIARALEILYISGERPSSFWQEKKADNACPYPLKVIALLPEDRSKLHQKIELRFKQMLEQGLIEEVQTLEKKWPLSELLPSMRTVGYRQVLGYLKGKYDKNTMIEMAIAATRQLAKRQITWLRSFMGREGLEFYYV